MKTITYKDISLVRVAHDKGCWGCYFLSKEMGCYCPEYLECGAGNIFLETAPEVSNRTKFRLQAKDQIVKYLTDAE